MPVLTIQQAFDLALQHHQAGKLVEAETLYRQILTVEPRQAETLHLLGVIAHQVGKMDQAVNLINQAIALRPDLADAHYNLGCILKDKGLLDEATAAFRRAIALKKDYPEACNNLAALLILKGQPVEAIEVCRQSLAVSPNNPEALTNLGIALKENGQLDEAVAAQRQAIALRSDYAEAHNNLGNALKEKGELDDAIAAYGRAISLRPAYYEAHSNLLFTRHFHPDYEAHPLQEERRRWNLLFTEPLRRFLKPHLNDRGIQRRLRIGYVSGDFRDHVVGRNILPILEMSDRENFEVFLYANSHHPDALSRRLKRAGDVWHDIAGISDEATAELIRADQIDILVDLSQHMAGNRLTLFARQAAPVQVSFAGYPESTGLEAIGNRISDKWMEQGGVLNSDGLLVKVDDREEVYLMDSFWCYDPCGLELNVNDLPAQKARVITFGSLNNFCKVNDPLLRLWAQVLRTVTGSRLVILAHEGSHRHRTRQFLEAEGIESHRVEFVSPRPRKEYLELHHRLDIVLDTFPYNGHTTSLDALWMGVPVVSLCGECPVSRAGLSQLSNLGLPELVTFTEEQYVETAAKLANDIPRLQELRAALRSRMEKSVLMDAPHFARQIEAGYRSMWRRWCENQKA